MSDGFDLPGAVRDMQRKLDALYRAIYQGNGSPPMLTQIAAHELRLKSLESARGNWRHLWMSAAAAVIGAVGAAAVMGFFRP